MIKRGVLSVRGAYNFALGDAAGFNPLRFAGMLTVQGVANTAGLLLEGRGATCGGYAVTSHNGGTELPESPVFCGAKNAPAL
jgi:hypothetical protein